MQADARTFIIIKSSSCDRATRRAREVAHRDAPEDAARRPAPPNRQTAKSTSLERRQVGQPCVCDGSALEDKPQSQTSVLPVRFVSVKACSAFEREITKVLRVARLVLHEASSAFRFRSNFMQSKSFAKSPPAVAQTQTGPPRPRTQVSVRLSYDRHTDASVVRTTSRQVIPDGINTGENDPHRKFANKRYLFRSSTGLWTVW